MHPFIDTRDWPVVYLSMPDSVPDEHADASLTELVKLYARAEPFILCMSGAELPQHSPQFLSAYLRWTRDHFALQRRYCLGAIRIEADEPARLKYQRRAADWAKSGQAPYPYHVVATQEEALALAQTLWSQHLGADTAPRDAGGA